MGCKGLPIAFVCNVLCVMGWPALVLKAHVLYLCSQASQSTVLLVH